MMILVIVCLCVTIALPCCSADTNTLIYTSKLIYLDLSGNMIKSLDNSAFRNQNQLETLILSGNLLQNLGSELFTDCTNLRSLYLSGNNITQINTSSFRGLKSLERLDLSNNNIQELDPLVFQNTLTSSGGQTRQFSKLKHLNLTQNKIRSFNFKFYLAMSNNADNSTATLQLDTLDLSSNFLNCVDVEVVKSSKMSKTHIDFTGNPWECECYWLRDREKEQREQSLPCPLANNMTEDRCSVLERISSDKGVTSGVTGSSNGQVNQVKEVKDTSLVTTLFVVNGVLLATTFAGGVFIVVQLVKKMRKGSKVPQYDDIYVPLQGGETTVRVDPSTDSKTYNEIPGHVYETVA